MTKGFIFYFVFATLFIFPFFVFNIAGAETVPNAGFGVNGIILSDTTPVMGESIKVGMPLFNQTDGVLTGSVQFIDNNVVREVKKFALVAGQFSGVTFVWSATTGKHNLVLRLDNTTLKLPKKVSELVVLDNREALLRVDVASSANASNSNDVVPAGLVGPTQQDDSPIRSYNIDSEKQDIITAPIVGIDAYRSDFLGTVEASIAKIKKDITENLHQNQIYQKKLADLRTSMPRSGSGLLTPLQYLYVWFLGAAAFVTGNPFMFYGLGGFIIFLILRFIIRKLFRHHRHHNV